ncbi:MAG: TrkH family potassium uptake protein [Treponema sp.]|nr:TrkH family potassium uptake protein [Treponema sp.]
MTSVVKIIAAILSIVSITFILPVSVALYYKEYNTIKAFLIPLIVTIAITTIIFIATRNKKIKLSFRSSYVVVALSWTLTGIFGSIPLFLSGTITNIPAAIFESVSGFTTTGATVINEIDNLPKSINVWRCLEHWLGGMGIVTLTVALLPLIGVGGFQLIKAETTGPEKGKVTPKIASTAKVLWFIYLGMTLVQIILLKLAGMNIIDSICHAFATLGTGGFSTKSASIGYYNSTAIDIICTIFMFLAGINFSLYFYIFTGKFYELKTNSEFKAYLLIFITVTILVTISIKPIYGSILTALRYSSFQVASIITTTGFATADYTTWPSAAQVLIFILFFIGGCSGSTGGGIKVVRWVILSKQVSNEMKKALHPHGVYSLRLNGQASGKGIILSVASFVFLYLTMVIISTIIASFFGMEFLTSFTASLSMAGNIGPAFSLLGPSYTWANVPSIMKIIYSFEMLAGRLELYTMLIFFLPDFWKK